MHRFAVHWVSLKILVGLDEGGDLPAYALLELLSGFAGKLRMRRIIPRIDISTRWAGDIPCGNVDVKPVRCGCNPVNTPARVGEQSGLAA